MRKSLLVLLLPIACYSAEKKKTLTGNFDLGINFTKNIDNTLQLNNVFFIKYRVNNIYWITASNDINLISKTGNENLLNKGAQELKYSLIDKGWDIAINLEHHYDISRDIKNRYSTGLGFAYNFSKIKEEKIMTGFSLNREKEVNIEEVSTVQNRFNTDLHLVKKITDKVNIHLNNSYAPNLEKFGDFRWRSNMEVKIKINMQFSLSINATYNYDSDPSPDIPESDYNIIHKISYNF